LEFSSSSEEGSLLGCYAVWLLQEPHGVTTQKTPFFIVTAVKTSNLTVPVVFTESEVSLWLKLEGSSVTKGKGTFAFGSRH
jgi:hypothetical protein